MTHTDATRTVDGVEIPVPGVWEIDPSHADVSFVGRHFMLTKVRGGFIEVDGEVHITERPEDSSVKASIEMASVYSGFGIRDDNLRSSNVFDAENYPQAIFTSTHIDWDGVEGEMTGDLTIKDVTKPVTLAVRYLGHVSDPWGKERIGFEAHGSINREDWGLTWNMAVESGGVMVSNEIDLELHIELVLAS